MRAANFFKDCVAHELILLHFVSTAEACTEEGGLKLTGTAPGNRQYLQVCHIGAWRYLCEGRFSEAGADGKVVLQQLGCSSGGKYMFFLLSRHALISIILYTTDVNKASGVNNNNVYRMSASGCTGVEKKLTECPRYLQVNKITSCNNKVTVKCNGEFDCFKTLV